MNSDMDKRKMANPKNSAVSKGKTLAQHRKEAVKSWLSSTPFERGRLHPDSGPTKRKLRSGSSKRVNMDENRKAFQDALLHHGKAFLGQVPTENPLGDLDNELHPLFKYENWWADQYVPGNAILFENKVLWDNILPSLRLASLFISETNMLNFFVDVAFAHIPNEANTTPWYTPCMKPYWPYRQTDHARVRHIFEVMSKHVTFDFSLHVPNYHGMTDQRNGIYKDYERVFDNGEVDKYTLHESTCFIGFAPYIKEYFLRRHSTFSPATQVEMSLHFASIVVHEVAHAFFWFARPIYWMKTWEEWQAWGSRWQDEPYIYEGSAIAEMGYAWQLFALGPFSHLPKETTPQDDQSRNMYLASDDRRSFTKKGLLYTNRLSRLEDSWFVETSPWVHAWFRKETWARIAQEGHRFMVAHARRLKVTLTQYEMFKTVVVSTVELDGNILEQLICTPEYLPVYHTVRKVDISEAFANLEPLPQESELDH
jgi:hypothetical protein